MIFSRLHGRLGNQMFQYAAARALAERLGTRVVLDDRTALHKGDGTLLRVFDLPDLGEAPLPPAKHQQPLAYAAWRGLGKRPRIRREKGLGYNPDFAHWADDSYLHGYWQSEQYFADIADTLRSAFVFRTPMSAQNAEMAARIASGPSVALHVRRGDYVQVNTMALCDQSYYDAALAAIRIRMDGDPTVYVFSDDPDWAKANLPLPFDKVVVDSNGPDADYEDLRLMSLCQHNIIANSSFSWWAAWLGETPDSIVAGPSRWFADTSMSNPDILPARWISVGTTA
ncbi:Glycosyl transferase family 11 [Pseudosulfitobacter pseudonitzschiae]|uniref:Alpha-1,2-fucosyltransferase n=1 Tax=Pseudosulfitobacter pseudonitzschiae TaxID=1402135 RepID=A0A073J6G6_9RHOB|nr:alpha-1,2-fucosyltransferase [Pseudosulfitobacter pseudonitzschiae]KEJ97311.1 alpha-1,2-fucosyltransferase [Pseudosulfitobacter pseudonitzschiae]QKS10277.1 alpha-1,2-fucosyltransferase [Pseudosulfitobacter pseudonitzschiae]SHF56974.1 Glycosyl transferase family 11 [Pseudosulfitobacter pseudonitzschiae]